MAKLSLQGKELRKIGYPEAGNSISTAIQLMHKYYKHTPRSEALRILKEVLYQPEKYIDDETLQKLAALLKSEVPSEIQEITLEQKRKDFAIFGREEIEESAINQMELAMKLPITVTGALMPDAHHGFGLPIGGVLATKGAVIPYAVGVDIGCRMALTVFQDSDDILRKQERSLVRVLESETRFGAGSAFANPRDHDVLSNHLFQEIKVLRHLHAKAAAQIGTSGSGNHFVEFGLVTIPEFDPALGIPPGRYPGLLSHSGSRGFGAGVAEYYTKVARDRCRLSKEARHFAWLDLDTQEGQEYWLAMNLAGDYASACHQQIHEKIAKSLHLQPLARIENHHNFAWKESLNGQEVIVHRKGATPAGDGVLGIIPGSMVASGFIVKGKGMVESVFSASHGAGRKMSRARAKQSVTVHALHKELKSKGITLLGGGVDEAPMAYKEIDKVMNAQKNLIEVIGTLQPKIVRMDG